MFTNTKQLAKVQLETLEGTHLMSIIKAFTEDSENNRQRTQLFDDTLKEVE